jgi:hydroxymethylpyrimidine pyrophosphatase-like HAD family hydrolase
MDGLWQHVGGHGLAVCSNGGIVYDVHAHAVSTARTMPRHVALQVAGLLRGRIPGCTFAVEKVDGYAREAGFMSRLPPPPDVVTGPVEEIVDGSVVKLLARHEELEPEDFWSRVDAAVGHLVSTTWSSTGALVEISAAGVTKASTLELVCRQHDVDASQVVAFGDMPNDLPMLAWAGTSYAMRNAHPAVRALADHVAPSNEHDGVAAVLEELFEL